MKLKGEFEIISVGDETMAVPVGENAGETPFVIRLNNSAAEIFKLLKDDITEEEIIEKLSNKYENGKEEIAIFVREVIKEYTEKGIVCDNA